jgi:acetyl esterase/lipase
MGKTMTAKVLSKLSLTVILLLVANAAPAAEKPATKPAAKPTLPPAPEGVIIEQDVAYLPPDRAEKLDIYLPKSRGANVRSPAVLIIHGGGFTGGDKAASREFNIGTTLAKAGYVCASVNYSLAEAKRWPQNVLDCKNAVRFLRKNADKYQIDSDHIGAIGGSAGGHLSLMVAYTSDIAALEPNDLYPGVSDRISAVVDMYGPTDFATRRKTDAEGNPIGEPLLSATAFLTESYAQNPELWKLMSPVSHVNAKSPPTLILHGTKDTTVDRDQSKELDAKLKAAGVEHQLLFVEGAGHTFDLEKWGKKPLSTDLRPVVTAFFDKHLKK